MRLWPQTGNNIFNRRFSASFSHSSFHEEDLRIRSKPVLDEKPLSSSVRVLEETAAISDRSDSDDEWEGVESTELDETFSAATAFVAAMAAQKVSNEVQLQLYGLYKIATEGPCSAAQP